MDPGAFYAHRSETPSSSFPDWVGVPGSPSASNLALMGLEDEPATITSFDQDIDDALGRSCDPLASLNFACPLDPIIDWQSLFNATMPFPPPALTDDISSTTGSSDQPLSPLSDLTLVNSPSPSQLSDFKLPPPGDALVDRPAAPSPLIFDDFMFNFEPAATMPSFDMSTALLQQDCHYADYDYSQGQYWPGQQLSQHSVGAACAVAPGLATDMEMNADAFAFTAMDLTSPPPLPVLSPEPQQDPSHADEKANTTCTTRKRPCRLETDSSYSASESGNEVDASTRKRRKQDTTRRFPCPYSGCDAVFSRTHNREVHVNDVHLDKRGHACIECPCAFKRKHDLTRHIQSKHTNLGSPRNANNANNVKGAIGKGAKGRKAAAKKGALNA